MSFPPLTLMQNVAAFPQYKEGSQFRRRCWCACQKSAVENVNLFVLHKQCASYLVLMVIVWPPHIEVVT
jgi:hypothetical protein